MTMKPKWRNFKECGSKKPAKPTFSWPECSHRRSCSWKKKKLKTAFSFEMCVWGGVALIDEENLIPVHQSIFSLSLSSVSTCELDICWRWERPQGARWVWLFYPNHPVSYKGSIPVRISSLYNLHFISTVRCSMPPPTQWYPIYPIHPPIADGATSI